MGLKYNKQANALYLKIDKEQRRVADTIPLGSDRFIDVDESGQVLGIEILLKEDMPQEAFVAISKTKSIQVTQ